MTTYDQWKTTDRRDDDADIDRMQQHMTVAISCLTAVLVTTRLDSFAYSNIDEALFQLESALKDQPKP